MTDERTAAAPEEVPQEPRSRRGFPLLLELLAAGMVVFASLWSSLDMLKTYGDQVEMRTGVLLCAFSPAAMIASGRGMRGLDIDKFPQVRDFFRLKTHSMPPEAIPADYEGFDVRHHSYCLMHWHLIRAIGWTWRLLGISHRSLHFFAAALYAALMLVLYGWFRVGMGRAAALPLTLFMAFSPAFLIICASLRDFSKAPFLLGAVLMLVHLAARPRDLRFLCLWSGAAGLVSGVGFGFRQDLLLVLPLALAALAFLVPVKAPRPGRARAAAACLFLGLFALAGWMPLRGTRLDNGSASAQASVQGVSQEVESRLELGGASYVHHYGYSDWLDFTVVNAHARRHGDRTPMEGHFTPGHGRAGGRLVREYWMTFPGDMAARALSALWMLPRISSMVDEPYVWYNPEPSADYLKARQEWYRPVARSAAIWGWPALAAALALLFVSRPRAALLLGAAVALFGAYPSLLYEFRHLFHFSFLAYWAAGTVVWQSLALALRLRREPGFWRTLLRRLGIFSAAALGGCLLLLGGQWGARAWQDRQLHGLLTQYAEAPLDPVPVERVMEEQKVLLRPADVLPGLRDTATLPPFEVGAEYVAVEFQNVRGPVPLDIVYEQDPATNFSRYITLPRNLFDNEGNGTFFFPVYELVWPPLSTNEPMRRGAFRGVRLGGDALKAFSGMSRVRNANDFSLWPHIVIPKNAEAFRPHKTGPLDRFLPGGDG
ncbi:MAG TPA: hypothetical protein PKV69_03590 [Candidatus Hydrogenedentes bacterium]|nr:hypothetical protein [Candidatus Hydrogenedentota bacterium]